MSISISPAISEQSSSAASKTEAQIPSSNDSIPVYRIDLSLPPSERYVQLATEFAPKMQKITPLLDEVLSPAFPSERMRGWIKWLARLFLRRVYSAEETAEIKGISKASGVDLYFLVALNVLLDSLLGCTSGAVVTRPKSGCKAKSEEEKGEGDERRMMHFRTLDWGMDPLRSVLVVLEFVQSKSEEPDKIIGRTITYAGFVGVLTGLRKDLSISLNFRPNHDCSTFKLRMHQLAILFGFSPSISSIIRSALFPPPSTEHPPISELTTTLSHQKTPPCYLILCDGTSATVLEKDLVSAQIRSSDEFIVHTNNDTLPTSSPSPDTEAKAKQQGSSTAIIDMTDMDDFLKGSRERSACVQKKWDAMKERQRRNQQAALVEESEMVPPSVREDTLIGWVKKDPLMNSQSYFGCLMDPKMGEIRWLERGEYFGSDQEWSGDSRAVSEIE